MKSPLPSRFLLAALLPLAAVAQTAPSAPVGDVAARDEVIVLSPFVVSSESENGYLATETLAGMRIRTNLKDVGAAVDVLTESFLNDVGATDMNDALKYVANMQYADFPSTSDASNASQWFSASFVSRGIVGSTVLTDFFPTGSVPIDRYNTENLTMMRGPNAILFGIGSPSGIVGASAKRALFSRNQGSVRFQTDTHETMRTELDVNRILIPDKLAIRIAALASDKRTSQEPSLDRRNAVFGTVTYKPWTRTTITANIEEGKRDRVHVQNHVVMDAYTPWVLAGKPMVTSRVGFPATGPAYSTGVGSGLQNQSTGSYLVYIENDPSLPVMDWRGMARGSQWGNMVPGTAAFTPGTMLNTDRDQMNNIGFNAANAIVPLESNIFGGLNRNDQVYDSKSVFIEQNLARDLDLELAWNEFTSDYLFRIHAY
ncbi:MAG TPA: TonB-dependent receptor plug domain-containing protein, partial [Lacunisphaera sp.]|nr:TonB-dependent receptor plug domain-containing protein [Lacunisphaera sp.]